MAAADVGAAGATERGTANTIVRSKREDPAHVLDARARMKKADVGGAPVPGAKRGKRAANRAATAASAGDTTLTGDAASE